MRFMLAAALAAATILITSISVAYAKPTHRVSTDKSACTSHSYSIEALFKCDEDEFITPSFSVSPSLCSGQEVGVAVLEFYNSADGGSHYLAKKMAQACSKPAYRRWADSRKCPQLTTVVNGMNRFALPRPRLESDGAGAMVMDGSLFILKLTGFYPKERTSVGVELSGQDNSPVGKWVATALKMLEPCWTDRRPPR